jgi:hypothetical protein
MVHAYMSKSSYWIALNCLLLQNKVVVVLNVFSCNVVASNRNILDVFFVLCSNPLANATTPYPSSGRTEGAGTGLA